MSITIGIACLALMLVMFMQFKVVKQTDITEIETMKESELRLELKNWNDKYDELNAKYEELSSKIEEYKNEKESDAKTYQLLTTELEQLNESLGKTDVEGEGIVIQLTDKGGTQLSDDVQVDKITSTQILTIINELFSAGADAISVNDQRVVLTTSIECDGNVIKINGIKIGAPFEIKAIGFPEYLSGAMNRQGGYLMNLKEYWGIETSVTKSSDITIPKYTGVIKYNYAESN